MRILQINKFFSVQGGSDTVFFETIEGLRGRGHTVVEFSMRREGDRPSAYEKYFVSPVSLRAGSLAERWRAARRIFSSSEVTAKLTQLVKDTRPDAAHVHNAYRELSASTFLTLKKLGVPIVHTVHDMFPLCPNHSFILGETLAEAKLNRLYKCVINKCVNGSFTQSLAGAAEAYYYRARGIWKKVDRFIAPSEFMKDKLIQYGFPAERIRKIMYPAATVLKNIPPLGDKIVYLSRLHVERGIRVFMRAVKDLKQYRVVVAGDGPEAAWVDQFIKDNRLTHVERRGWVSGAGKEAALAEARAVVVPAIFYDLCSLTILEALALGRLVVASDRGGNPELVIDGKTGWLARPEDPADLARAIQEAMTAPQNQVESMVAAGRDLVRKNHDLGRYLDNVEAVYAEVKMV
ncbi:MAG: group 1 glycosyl transferase [Parcubacteria group bacterium GW2011_GWA2_53_21]|nr:MAG: group 1 glycosyl transferase [Parcubacteria group bacterium GW2011_GWA2_53_21]